MSTILVPAQSAGIPSDKTGSRIPTLDGWRGVAILLVLFDHFQVSLFGHDVFPWTQTGQHGVTIFFVLSGFLITSKLTQGPIELKKFYLRRIFRLLPAAWAFLAIVLLFDRLTGMHATPLSDIRACLLFYRNYYHSPTAVHFAGHFWSLSLEEQFYLLWPWVLVLAGAGRSKWIAISGAGACAVYRYLHWSFYANVPFENYRSQVRADALLVGCLLALLLSDPSFKVKAKSHSARLVVPSFVLLLFCMARFHSLPPLIESLAIAALISASTLNSELLVARALSVAPLAWLGVASYSIYLWQQFFIQLGEGPFKAVSLFVALPAFSLMSYFWIETPCVQLGHRISNSTEKGIGPASARRRGDDDLPLGSAPEVTANVNDDLPPCAVMVSE
jgi:peptidoglycan/LPS O-acetylase OafA/YrhL